MARKKQQTVKEMITEMGNMQKKVDAEIDRIADVLASQMDYKTAMILGDLSDRELRLVANFMFRHMWLFRCLALLNAAKPEKLQDADDGPMVEGELQYNNEEHCWEVWDAGKKVGILRDGMCVEIAKDIDNRDWETFKIKLRVWDCWCADSTDESDADGFRGYPMLYDDLRVRFRKA